MNEMVEMGFRRLNTALLMTLVLVVVDHEWGSPWGAVVLLGAIMWAFFMTAAVQWRDSHFANDLRKR